MGVTESVTKETKLPGFKRYLKVGTVIIKINIVLNMK